MRGRFITFEGGEGAGKSTQVRLLAQALQAVGREVVTTREPGGSATAEAIRGLLLSGRARPLGTLGEAYLFAAARIDHLAETIRPALERGRTVLCDRFMDSTRVYQGTAGALDAATIDALEQAAVGDTRPDLTIIIDVPVAIGLGRIRARSGAAADRFEADDVAVHEARRAGFLALARAEPQRCVVVDGSGDPEAVAAAVRAAVQDRLAIALPAGS
ncbi:dTMP kinase [Chthonobacter rhizosphaerae]|uniref:dTMP kinase n=1 Tax=Chthonobacter rhizosphaerae TaxID=2735553 RepID=UPI0015EEB205